MFVYDSSWQLCSSVQSVESPHGLELGLCQLSSRCPGSGERVKMHVSASAYTRQRKCKYK